MSSTPATPSLDDLRQAAVAVETTTVVPPTEPVVAPPADPWKVTSDGGNYQVEIEGQVFKGTHQQVLNELAKAQYNATKTIRETRHELETFKAQPPQVQQQAIQQAQQPATPTDPPEVLAARAYLADETAKALGFRDAAELKQGIQRMNGVVENTSQNELVSGFFNIVPDFPDNKETVEKLFSTLAANGLPETPQGLRAAHLIAVAEKQYTPLTPDQIREQQIRALGLQGAALTPPTPAPMVPSSSGVTTTAPFDPYAKAVTLDQVKAWAQQAEKR